MTSSQNGIMKASFCGGSVDERKNFKDSHAMLLISVGQPYHEAQKFSATLELVNRSFKSCTIVVADTLQRHNLAAEREEDMSGDYFDESLQCGDEWIIRNKPIYEKLTIPCDVVRWTEFLENGKFASYKDRMEAMYEESAEFKEAVHLTIEEYLNRYQRRHDNVDIDYTAIYGCCFSYIIEECAVMCSWIHSNYHFEVYPNPRNPAMNAVYELLIKPKSIHLLKPVNLRFKRHSRFLPQEKIKPASENETVTGDSVAI